MYQNPLSPTHHPQHTTFGVSTFLLYSGLIFFYASYVTLDLSLPMCGWGRDFKSHQFYISRLSHSTLTDIRVVLHAFILEYLLELCLVSLSCWIGSILLSSFLLKYIKFFHPLMMPLLFYPTCLYFLKFVYCHFTWILGVDTCSLFTEPFCEIPWYLLDLNPPRPLCNI